MKYILRAKCLCIIYECGILPKFCGIITIPWQYPERVYSMICPQKLYNFATGKPFNIFPKLFFQWVGIHEESSPVQGRWSVGVMRGVAGPRPFF